MSDLSNKWNNALSKALSYATHHQSNTITNTWKHITNHCPDIKYPSIQYSIDSDENIYFQWKMNGNHFMMEFYPDGELEWSFFNYDEEIDLGDTTIDNDRFLSVLKYFIKN